LVGTDVVRRAAPRVVHFAPTGGILIAEPTGDLIAGFVEKAAPFAIRAPFTIVAVVMTMIIMIVSKPACHAVFRTIAFAGSHSAGPHPPSHAATAGVEVPSAVIRAGEAGIIVAVAGVVEVLRMDPAVVI